MPKKKKKKKKIKITKSYIIAFAVILLIEVLIAVFVHDNFIRPYVGDVLVIVLIYCFLRIFLPPYIFLPPGIFFFAATVEFLQLFNFAKILGVQDNRVLSVIIGSTFDLNDITCYAVGYLIVYMWQFRNDILKKFIKRDK